MSESNQAARAWEEAVVLPTYPAPPADLNPMFVEKRVYQGSSGKVYPNPFTDRISDRKVDRTYRAVFLENEYVRLMILPEIGGRIHVGFDKTNNYDFFYRQNVIKPALVGLLGPWISGGVEFNWPQHHRPSTFMPVDHHIEEHDDGSCTVWLSEHEPMNRMKGMVGICLRPGKSIVEAKVRLYNRTPFVQTFLWWANVAVRVHDEYQSFFPPDVNYVADHAKRAISSFPLARNFYYGVDYTTGVDITRYRNIPVPTSYMVTRSDYDFFGGYDHSRKAGLVHVANRFVAPGKKQWTWGNAGFGYAWDRELTDSDGPYIELMAGVYTDNQPDFSFLQPYETKTFSQFWYPIQEIGPAKNANRRAAVNLEVDGQTIRVGVCASESIERARVLLSAGQDVLFEETVNVQPGRPFLHEHTLARACPETDLLLRVLSASGEEIIRYRPEATQDTALPEPATEPLPPQEIANSDELYITGLHLEQYRHATRYPEPYWEEALRRDPGDARSNNALGMTKLRRGQFAEAEAHFRRAIVRLTGRNPNPYDGEPYYNLGLALKFQERFDEAYTAFYKSVWNYAWQAAGYYELAAIDCREGDLGSALEHLERSLQTNTLNLKARNLRTAVLRHFGRAAEAASVAGETLAMDPLDFWCRNEQVLLGSANDGELFALMRHDAQTCLDIALDYAAAGLWPDAIGLLKRFLLSLEDRPLHPMVLYALASFCLRVGADNDAREYRRLAAQANPDYCFPARLEEMSILEAALQLNPEDARAPYYLGNLFYDKRRYEDAIRVWTLACERDPHFSIPWRNLGIAWYNVRRNPDEAVRCYERARGANPNDARLLYELDQLHKRVGVAPSKRLDNLERSRALVDLRDDLTIELIALYNQTGRSEDALRLLGSRRFHPWEGGEGMVTAQYVAAHLILGRAALLSSDSWAALEHFTAARNYPDNLGEGKHLLTRETDLDYFSGVAHFMLGNADQARVLWSQAAHANTGETPFAYYRALALRQLGDREQARQLLLDLLASARRAKEASIKIDYFATSLPNFLLFEDDLEKRNRIDCLFLESLAHFGLGNRDEALAGLRQVLTLDPNHAAAQHELRALLSALIQESLAPSGGGSIEGENLS